MSTAVARVLREVEQLSDRERVELRRALMEQISMSDDLTDADFAALASTLSPTRPSATCAKRGCKPGHRAVVARVVRGGPGR